MFSIRCARCHYFYPRPLRGGRLLVLVSAMCPRAISIHALCEEGDATWTSITFLHLTISIHALCEEGDSISMSFAKAFLHFYPRPLRGGRQSSNPKSSGSSSISIHALCEEGDSSSSPVRLKGDMISIHALCEEGDPTREARRGRRTDFYPRPLRGGRPAVRVRTGRAVRISIHALCEEGDAGSAGGRP